jgi:hypothetical protein
MHADNHRRGSAVSSDTFDDLCGCSVRYSQASDLLRADETEKPGTPERPHRVTREVAGAVNLRRRRSYDLIDDLINR